MSTSPFPAIRQLPRNKAGIQDVTLRDFSGGIKVTDNETALRNKFSIVADNIFRDEERGMRVRFGTKKFAETTSDVLDMVYFSVALVAFLKDGTIEAITEDGTVTTIWNDTIAGLLVGEPDGWTSGATSIDTAVFNGNLIVVNNQDKPLIIAPDLTVDYLQDLATGSNLFTPVTKYVTAVTNYCVMGGFDDTDELFISSSGTSGTWPGDDPPNNAVSIRLGAYTATSGKAILGLADFRNNLAVFFEDFVLLLQLDVFDSDGVHTPKVLDTLQDTSIINHRSLLVTNKEIIFAAQSGVFSLSQTVFSPQLEPKSFTENLGRDYVKATANVPISCECSFHVRDKAQKQIFFFLKQSTGWITYVMSHKDDFKQVAWSTASGWDWDGGCTSIKNRVFFFKENEVFKYGNSLFDTENYAEDFIDDLDEDAAMPIVFDWELPWLDANSRVRSKALINVAMETNGTGTFWFSLFIDKYFKDLEDNYTPVMQLAFRGGDTAGYGTDVGGYGGGRRTSDERMYRMPSKFNILKMRLHGSTREPLQFSSITIIYRAAQGFRR